MRRPHATFRIWHLFAKFTFCFRAIPEFHNIINFLSILGAEPRICTFSYCKVSVVALQLISIVNTARNKTTNMTIVCFISIVFA